MVFQPATVAEAVDGGVAFCKTAAERFVHGGGVAELFGAGGDAHLAELQADTVAMSSSRTFLRFTIF